MGQKQSKIFEITNNELAMNMPIKVIENNQFNENFLKRLEGGDQIDLDSKVQEQVDRELALYEQRRLLHEKRSVFQVATEAQKLLERSEAIPVLQISPEIEATQNDLILCYKNNPSRVLDCWKEVDAFKLAEREALKVSFK